MRRLLPCLLALLANVTIGAIGASPALATDAFDPTGASPQKTERWAKLELLTDPSERMVQERFIPLVEHHDPEVVAGFGGDASPPSSQVLLHYAKGWDEATADTPVVLVHGAGLTSNHCYADQPIGQPYEGMAPRLARAGRAVFAVTFAHMHGDNFLQAEALANAIARVKHVTGKARVDLVAHSKGGMAARIYVSDLNPSWGTRYRKDVRRYVMLGTPNGGIDVSFAYPNLNYWVLENKAAAPLSWTEGLYWGKWLDWRERSLYREGAFPGQAQMVARWDHRVGRTRAEGQFDVTTTYEGGRGQVSVSRGIERAIEEGGDLIARLAQKPAHADVELAVLAGTSNWIMHLVGERRGPSDGLLLVASALDVEPMTKKGAKLIRARSCT